MLNNDHYEKTAIFLQSAMKSLGVFEQSTQIKILDFGCGSGKLVKCFLSDGYDVYGCDIKPYWQEYQIDFDINRLATISLAPYRLPYDDGMFDVVISTSVMEHAQNKDEIFSELFRILKKNGYSIHLFPSKFYLPVEPHILVPLANYFWPNCPKWWFRLWAFLGVRNEFQRKIKWQQVVKENIEYCKTGLSYWSNKKYRLLSMKVFGNYSAPMVFYIQNSHGGTSKLLKKLPFQRFFSWLAGEIRMNFIISKKLS